MHSHTSLGYVLLHGKAPVWLDWIQSNEQVWVFNVDVQLNRKQTNWWSAIQWVFSASMFNLAVTVSLKDGPFLAPFSLYSSYRYSWQQTNKYAIHKRLDSNYEPLSSEATTTAPSNSNRYAKIVLYHDWQRRLGNELRHSGKTLNLIYHEFESVLPFAGVQRSRRMCYF